MEWLRGQIGERLETARVACDGDSGHWFAGDKWNVYRAEDEAAWDTPYEGDEHKLVVYGNVKPQSEHIALNDPRDTIARCEAELAILDEHASDEDPVLEDCIRCGTALHAGPCECPNALSGQHEREALAYPCPTVRHVASAYKHHEGWGKHWGQG